MTPQIWDPIWSGKILKRWNLGEGGKETTERVKRSRICTFERYVRPEFLNRIDEVIMFRPHDRKRHCCHCDDPIARVEETPQAGNICEYTPDFLDWLAYRGYQPEFLAAPLKGSLQKKVLHALSKQMLINKIKAQRTRSVGCIWWQCSGIQATRKRWGKKKGRLPFLITQNLSVVNFLQRN